MGLVCRAGYQRVDEAVAFDLDGVQDFPLRIFL